MSKQEIVDYWYSGARKDKKVADDMYRLKHYDWCLFMWHLVIEKMLKGVLTENDIEYPFSHKLAKLANLTKFPIDSKTLGDLEEISSFNLNARYSDYKMKFYKKANKIYTDKWIDICKKIYVWLKKQK